MGAGTDNVIMFVTLGIYVALPGQITLNPVRMTDTKLLVMGCRHHVGRGAARALVLIRPILAMGFRFRWRWGFDRRLGQLGQLSLWLVAFTRWSARCLTSWRPRVATGAASGT